MTINGYEAVATFDSSGTLFVVWNVTDALSVGVQSTNTLTSEQVEMIALTVHSIDEGTLESLPATVDGLPRTFRHISGSWQEDVRQIRVGIVDATTGGSAVIGSPHIDPTAEKNHAVRFYVAQLCTSDGFNRRFARFEIEQEISLLQVGETRPERFTVTEGLPGWADQGQYKHDAHC